MANDEQTSLLDQEPRPVSKPKSEFLAGIFETWLSPGKTPTIAQRKRARAAAEAALHALEDPSGN